ncbi:MAG: MoaD/ThiS family protein [Chloroflexota bacterium]
MINIDIKLFATLKDRADSERIHVRLEEPATVQDLLAAVRADYPALAPLLASALVAVNRLFAAPDTPVQAGMRWRYSRPSVARSAHTRPTSR